MTEPTEQDKSITRLGAMYASAIFTLASVRTAAQGVIDGIVPHPKFQNKTKLVWADEIEELKRVLKDSEVKPPTGEVAELLRSKELPTYGEAVQMMTWLRGMMRLPEAEVKVFKARLDELGQKEAA